MKKFYLKKVRLISYKLRGISGGVVDLIDDLGGLEGGRGVGLAGGRLVIVAVVGARVRVLRGRRVRRPGRAGRARRRPHALRTLQQLQYFNNEGYRI